MGGLVEGPLKNLNPDKLMRYESKRLFFTVLMLGKMKVPCPHFRGGSTVEFVSFHTQVE